MSALWLRKSVMVLLSGLALSALIVATRADAPFDPSMPPRPRYEGLETLPFLDVEAPKGLEERSDAAVTGLADWSNIVFQSLRAGNWEIYLAKGDGSNQTRLTHDAASDIEPALNRGCTKIAFVSNRSGNYEIFSMNLDGTGLKQLTFHAASDGQPAWSPDGSRIAFRSFRDYQAEIYVMMADGSGLTRLTWPAEYDGQPAWSPDGAKIAFVSNRSGGYRVWVMNADGSGQTQLSTQSFSANPAWSPDGRTIAYDSDGDGDGWQELWLMNADGSNQRLVYDPAGSADAWVRSWSPDGRYVAFTRITWIYYRGNWYWTEAHLDTWDSVSGGIGRLSPQSVDWLPNWQTTDTQAPISKVRDLYAYTRGDLEVNWVGYDTAGAAFKSYDVQYRVASDSGWTDWKMDTTDTAAVLAGAAGKRYYFRSRARDIAYNLEPWPVGDGDTYTTFYTWAVTGTVRDIRGIPVMGAAVSTTPGAFEAHISDGNGDYAAFVASSANAYSGNWGKSGYGTLPAATFETAANVHFDVLLPTADNNVLDWGFETGNLDADGWHASGVITPVAASHIKHTGSFAAQVGRVSEPGVNVSRSPAFAYHARVAADRTGTVHILWSDDRSDQPGLYYRSLDSDGIWSIAENAANTHGGPHDLELATDDSRTVHVVWTDSTPGYAAIYYAQRESSGIWSSSHNLSNNPSASGFAQLATDDSGAAHVVWMDWSTDDINVTYRRRANNGTWSDPINVIDNDTSEYDPQIAVDKSGIVHVVWSQDNPDDFVGSHDIYYAWRGVDGIWSSAQNISNNYSGSALAQLATDDSGAVHVVWQDGTPGNVEIYYARRGSEGTWSSAQNISNLSSESSYPQLAVEGNGVVHVIWVEGATGNRSIYYAQRGADDTWSSAEKISTTSGDSGFPQLAVGNNGPVHVVWRDETPSNADVYYRWRGSNGIWSDTQNVSDGSVGSNEPQVAVAGDGAVHIVWNEMVWSEPTRRYNSNVYYAAPPPVERIGDSVLAQVLTVPTNATGPTISFLYQLGGASPSSGTWFASQVDDGLSTTTLFSTTTSTNGWTHRWFDMSAWSGNTVTLTFNVHQTTGTPRTGVYIDEVTLGSAYPDLWVGAHNVAALPGEEAVHAISYGNRGGVDASGVRITATLPAVLSFVNASPPPSATSPALVWEAGDLTARSGPYAIFVTTTVAPVAALFNTFVTTVNIKSAAPEVETHNNQVHAETFIGQRIYLPLMMKAYSVW